MTESLFKINLVTYTTTIIMISFVCACVYYLVNIGVSNLKQRNFIILIIFIYYLDINHQFTSPASL